MTTISNGEHDRWLIKIDQALQSFRKSGQRTIEESETSSVDSSSNQRSSERARS